MVFYSFALFVSSFAFIGPEKPHRGSGQLRYLFSSFKVMRPVISLADPDLA